MSSFSSALSAFWTDTVSALPFEAATLLGLALVLSSAGFLRTVYFVSLGYAFSIAAMAAAALALYREHLSLLVVLQCLALGAYGVRLGSYLLSRERRPAYQREAADAAKRSEGIGGGVKLAIWISVSLLYLLMFSPCLFNLEALRTAQGEAALPALPVGLAIMALGLGLEALADRQKSRYKSKHPDRFCDVGLYRFVRCPNYLGEISFWLGQFVAGASAYAHWLHWSMAGVGLICIVLIMMGSTKRLESKQRERYGDREDYQRYASTVPVLFPFVPIYSLENVKVYLE